MQSTSWETLGWKKQKLESRLPWEISMISDIQITPHFWQKMKKNCKASWWKWKKKGKNWAWSTAYCNEDHGIWSHHIIGNRWGNSGKGKTGLKAQHTATKIMASGPITSWEIDGETVEIMSGFTFGAPKSLQMVIVAMKLKDVYSLEGNLCPN